MAQIIELTQGYFALVDNEDFEELNRHKWSSNRGHNVIYAQRKSGPCGEQVTHYMHAQIMGQKGVDHISHDLLRFKLVDNRRSNLRIATLSQNNANIRKRKNAATSKYKGVYWDKAKSKWAARARRLFLGRFSDEREAASVYDAKAKELFGEFALTNSMLYPQDFRR